jgi:site-specific DNA-methyltransferase (adenine-specific)
VQVSTIGDVLSGQVQWAVLEADCAEVLPMLPNGAVDHVLTDPPYEAEAHTLQRRVKRAEPRSVSEWGQGDTRIAAVEPLAFPPITEAERVAAAGEYGRLCRRWCLVFCQIEAAMKWQESLVSAGMARRRIGVWVKPDGQPQLSGDRPGMGFESIVFAHAKGRSRWNGGGRSSVFTCNKFVPGDGANVHPTQKPLPLLMELVELFTDPWELVLDPFCGSGSLGIACVRLGRRYIGLDNGKDANGKPWAQWAREGIQAEERGLTRGAARAGQMGLFSGLATHRQRA